MRNTPAYMNSSAVLTLAATVFAMALLFAALANGNSAAAQTADTPTPVPTAEQPDDTGSIQNLPPIEGKLNPPQYPNMDSSLNRILQQVQTGQSTAQAAAANAPIHREESVAVTLYIAESYALDVWDWLEASGADPRNIGVDYIEAYVPVSLLPQTSQQEGVISVRTIVPPHPAQGDVITGGLLAHGVPAWYLAGIRGQGIKIGIIDIGFEGFRELMGTELPTSVQARCYTDVGVFTSNLSDCENADEDNHGVAVTETVFDIASRATYYISNPHSQGDLQTAVNWMTEQGVDVINMSLAWPWYGPGDGASLIERQSTEVSGHSRRKRYNLGQLDFETPQMRTWFGHFADPDLYQRFMAQLCRRRRVQRTSA